MQETRSGIILLGSPFDDCNLLHLLRVKLIVKQVFLRELVSREAQLLWLYVVPLVLLLVAPCIREVATVLPGHLTGAHFHSWNVCLCKLAVQVIGDEVPALLLLRLKIRPQSLEFGIVRLSYACEAIWLLLLWTLYLRQVALQSRRVRNGQRLSQFVIPLSSIESCSALSRHVEKGTFIRICREKPFLCLVHWHPFFC